MFASKSKPHRWMHVSSINVYLLTKMCISEDWTVLWFHKIQVKAVQCLASWQQPNISHSLCKRKSTYNVFTLFKRKVITRVLVLFSIHHVHGLFIVSCLLGRNTSSWLWSHLGDQLHGRIPIPLGVVKVFLGFDPDYYRREKLESGVWSCLSLSSPSQINGISSLDYRAC